MLRFHVITLFPDVCRPYFAHSMLGRAAERGILEVHFHNPIDEIPPSQRADDRPYGGGPGMVLRAEPVLRCCDRAYDIARRNSGAVKTVFFSPGGTQFTRETAKEYAAYGDIVLLCGHYEGMDERVAVATGADRVSVGPFVLTGGEIPALLVADAAAREIPGVLGNEYSCEDARIAGSEVYTRPEVIGYGGEEYAVPSVLLSGHHKHIDEYRKGTHAADGE